MSTRPRQLVQQYFFWNCFLSFIMRESLKKYFLMLLSKGMKSSVALKCHLPGLYWIVDYFHLTEEVLGIIYFLEKAFGYCCPSP